MRNFSVILKLAEESVEEKWGKLWKNGDRLSISEEEKFSGKIIKEWENWRREIWGW